MSKIYPTQHINTSSGFSLPSGTPMDVNRLPQMDIIQLQNRVDHLAAMAASLKKNIDQLEEIKVKDFQDNDVYEVNKRIERSEAKIALVASNSSKERGISLGSLFFVLTLNNILLMGLVALIN